MAKSSNPVLFFEALQKALGKIQEQGPGLIIVWGPCEYFVFKALNAIKTVWKNKTSSSSFAWEADELKKNAFFELCEQRNLFEKASLHVIRRVKKQAEFGGWLSSMNSAPQNVIVVSIESDKLTPKFLETAEKFQALLIPCQKPYKSELSSVANQLLKKRKLNLAPDALRALLNSVGEDLYALENEIERLSLIFTDEKLVSLAQLSPLLSTLSEDQSFKLITLLLEQKHTQAQLFVNELLRQGESPIGIASLIAWHCRNTLKMFELAARSDSKPPAMRLSYTLQKGYQQYIRAVKPLQIIEALMACQNSDAFLKSQRTPPEDLLALPLLSLAGSRVL